MAEKIDILTLTPEEHQALVCMFFAKLPNTDNRYKKRMSYWNVLQKRFNKKVSTYKNAKDAYDAHFDTNNRVGWSKEEMARRGQEYVDIFNKYHEYTADELEDAVNRIITLYGEEKSSFVTMKCGFPATVHSILDGQKAITIDGVYTLQDELKKGKIVFITLGGDKGKREVDWQPGFFGLGRVTKEPYDFDAEHKYFHFDIDIECTFGKTYKRDYFLNYLDAFDARYIGPELTRDPSQALSTLEDDKAVAVIRAVLDDQPELREIFATIFPADFINRVLGAVQVLVPVAQEFGESTQNAIEAFASEIDEVEAVEDDKLGEEYSKEKFLMEVFMTSDEYDLLKNLLLDRKNVILQGAPGVGKTFMAKRLAYSILGYKSQKKVQMVQFHQSYSYEDFIVGYRPNETGFEIQHGPFYDFCKMAEKTEGPCFFIIDEINRGNVSKIFGELLMLIEADKRNESLKLLYTHEDFKVPDNVYIIGMMNTADRSLAIIDYALRRRFAFYDVRPAFANPTFVERMESKQSDALNRLLTYVKSLNTEIANDDALGEGFEIGHSYFCTDEQKTIDKTWIKSVVEYSLIPLLKEYWFDDKEKADKWAKDLREVEK